jgi:hypothetical protein
LEAVRAQGPRKGGERTEGRIKRRDYVGKGTAKEGSPTKLLTKRKRQAGKISTGLLCLVQKSTSSARVPSFSWCRSPSGTDGATTDRKGWIVLPSPAMLRAAWRCRRILWFPTAPTSFHVHKLISTYPLQVRSKTGDAREARRDLRCTKVDTNHNNRQRFWTEPETALGGIAEEATKAREIWQIFVRPFRRDSIVIQVGKEDKTARIKEQIRAKLGTSTEQQRLIHAGNLRREGRTAAASGLGDGTQINLTVRMIGSPAADEVGPAAGEVGRPVGDEVGYQSLKIATLDVGKGLMGKMTTIIRELDEQGIHVAVLQEVNQGARPHKMLKSKGWYYKQSDGKNTGVATLIPWAWKDHMDGTWEGDEGRT